MKHYAFGGIDQSSIYQQTGYSPLLHVVAACFRRAHLTLVAAAVCFESKRNELSLIELTGCVSNRNGLQRARRCKCVSIRNRMHYQICAVRFLNGLWLRKHPTGQVTHNEKEKCSC